MHSGGQSSEEPRERSFSSAGELLYSLAALADGSTNRDMSRPDTPRAFAFLTAHSGFDWHCWLMVGRSIKNVTQYNYDSWAVLEWECCLKHPEDGAAEGAPFIQHHIIRVTERAFDDFAGGTSDKKLLRTMMGI